MSIRMLACPVPVTRTALPPHSLPLAVEVTFRRYRARGHIPARGTIPAHARLTADRIEGKDPKVAGSEPVTSPDQRKPGGRKASRIGAVFTILVLLSLLIGNHTGRVEDVFLIVIAGVLTLILIGDVVLRRNGLRS
ncbi:hypothetical protein GCM10023170_031220 [Phytohabitans houttuyneae]|uniref:DUF2631 domain-containing protein n=1 Tax=Phytohabitans houttuyneae TaxID=1076126 RepID=A0A6V8K8K0_9ACTN|nr:hypothetical protein Phou_022670 [Phytohabitans houttuyneae]